TMSAFPTTHRRWTSGPCIAPAAEPLENASLRSPRRSDCTRRQNRCRSEALGQRPRQACEEGDDVGYLLVLELVAELKAPHRLYRLRQSRNRSVVKIWWSHCDVAQGRHLEQVEIGVVVGDLSSSLVDGLAVRDVPIILHHAKFLIHPA